MDREDLSKGWRRYELGETCEIIMGNSPPGKSYNDEGERIRFLQGQNEFGENTPNSDGFTTEPSRMNKNGDILVTIRATPLGIANQADGEYYVGRGVAALRPKEKKLDGRYLYHYMKHCKESEYWRKVSTGSICSSVTKTSLQNLFVPLPSLSEQQKIANKLNPVIRGMDETYEVSSDAKVIEENLLRSCISGLMSEKRGSACETVKLDTVYEVILGNSLPREGYSKEDEGMRFLQGQKESGEETPISDGYTTDSSKVGKERNILIAIRATPLGTTNCSDDTYCLGRGVAGLRPEKSLDDGYLYYYMKIQHGYWEKISRGSTYPSIIKTNLQNLPIPLPKISEQQEIVEHLEYIETGIDDIHEASERMSDIIDVLSESVLSKAFQGELINDESIEERVVTVQSGLEGFEPN